MSVFVCPKCGNREYIFGQDGARRTAEELSTELLGQCWVGVRGREVAAKCGTGLCLHAGDVPLEVTVRKGGDSGRPVTVSDSSSRVTGSFRRIAERIWEKLHHSPERLL